jgi:glycosyltransferase involved in cell wall biosynthesis
MTALSIAPSVRASIDTLTGRDVICFSHDWNGDPLSKTHLMRLVARQNRILWVNSIGYRAPSASRPDVGRAFRKLLKFMQPVREVEPNILVLNPLAIPAYGRSWARSINQHWLRWQVRRAMRRLHFQRPINWIFNPAAAVVAGKLGEDLLIYHCVDEYTAFTGVAGNALAQLEEQLLRRADLVIVSADPLYRSKARFNPRTVVVRHGVDHQHFRRALDLDTRIPEDIAGLPRPVIGFFGLIADWVDVDLLADVARHFSHGSLVLLGKVATDVSCLTSLSNVHLLGRKSYEDLPGYCKGFDAALMPFRINRLTLNANPLKVREYLAAGLPVISTPIPEVEVLGQCRIAPTGPLFLRELEAALAVPGPDARRSAAIQHESWEARYDEVRKHLAEKGVRSPFRSPTARAAESLSAERVPDSFSPPHHGGRR